MGLDGDDMDLVMAHFLQESAAYQGEAVGCFLSFFDWMSGIGPLFMLIKYAAKIWKWIQKNW